MRHLVAVVLGGLLVLGGLVAFLWTSQGGDPRPVVERPDTTAADRAAVDELRDGYEATFTNGDVDGHADLFSDGAQILRNGNSVLVGRAAIRATAEETIGRFASEFVTSSEQVELMGDVAFDQGTFRLTQTPREGGDSGVYHGSYIVISRRQSDGSWKITQYMWNNRPAPGAGQ